MSGGSSSNRNECRIYVGNLPPDIRTKDIQDLFYKFGKVTFVDLKNRKGPPFAFVEFEDPRGSAAIVDFKRHICRDSTTFEKKIFKILSGTLMTQYAHATGTTTMGTGCASSSRAVAVGGGRGGRGGERFGPRTATRGPPARRSEYRVLVTGLPPSGSWQDLKDHMREAGDVCFADTFKDGSGVVEFLRHEDMKYAVKKLDDSRFRSHEGEVSYVRVKEDYGGSGGGGGGGGGGGDRSRSYSPRRRGSPTYSPVRRSYSRSRSRSRSHNY